MRGMVQAMRHPGLLHGAQGLRGKRELSTSLRETVTSLCSPVACSCAAQAPATVNEQSGWFVRMLSFCGLHGNLISCSVSSCKMRHQQSTITTTD
jgi:hypothetical protein